MFFGLNQFSKQEYKQEVKKLTTLALPMFIAQVAQVGTGVVDTVMAGRVSTDDLAAVSLGASLFMTLYVTLLGVGTAINPILSERFGAGQTKELGEVGRQGMWFCGLLGVLGMLVMLALTPLIARWDSLTPYVRDTTVLFVIGASLGMPAALLHRSLHAFASSLNKPKPIMIVSLVALLLNIPLNYILIHGLFGMPKLGGAGCGFATAAAFWFNFLVLWLYVSKHRYFKPFGLMDQFSKPVKAHFKSFFKLGLPIGLSYFLEVSLFTFIALLLAQFGAIQVASQQVVINFSSIVYMVPQTLGAALSVRVAQSIGAGSYLKARYISGVGVSVGLMCSIVVSILIMIFREHIVGLYTSEPEVIRIGSTLLIFAAIFQLSDSVQTIVSGALRGYKLTKVPMIIHAISFWGVGLGLGVYLGVYRDMEAVGFWIALVISLTVAAVLLFIFLAKRSKHYLLRDAI